VATIETGYIDFSAFGVRMEVLVPARLRTAALALTPPEATAGATDIRESSRVTVEEGHGSFSILVDGRTISAAQDEDSALGMLDAQIRAQVALLAPEHIFVHAGVVAVGGRAVLIPGSTFAGKTTLTRALVELGAVYYSDEFGAVDEQGLVHPYPRPLSIRHPDGSGRTTETPAATLGAETGREPVPVGLVAITEYRPGATLAPEPLASGAALLALLEHTIPARTRPHQTLAALKAALRGATAWKSERGEAIETARTIIGSMSEKPISRSPRAVSLGGVLQEVRETCLPRIS
jgi:hypothetical protein